MANQNLLEQATTLVKQRAGAAENAYEDLLTKLAGGGDEHPETIVAVVESAGRSLDQLQDDLAKLEGLATARKQLAELPAVLSRITAIEERRAELTAELNAAHKRIGAEQEQLSAELQLAINAQNRLEGIKQQIGVGKFDLPAQAAKRAEASRLVSRHGMAASNLKTELEQERRKVKSLSEAIDRAKASKQPDQNEINVTSAELAASRRRIAMIEMELRPLEKALAEANTMFAELAGSAT